MTPRNRVFGPNALGAGKRTRLRLDKQTLQIVQKHLASRSGADADFWSVVGGIELQQYQAIADRKLGARRAHLERVYRKLHERATSTRMWASVYDNAYLVLESYARAQAPAPKKGGKAANERKAAEEILTMLRTFAHPEDDQ